jgi:hypothetical protein
MCPDPDPKPDEEAHPGDEVPEGPADIVGLLALAKAYRTGTAPGGRDMKKCLETYRTASDLGSAEAEYAVALFHLSGGLIPQDLKEGTTRLRAAAEKGSVPARVYLANLYELGIHYKTDPEKADVWYRNAARASKVEYEPGTDEHTRELAALGCVRYVLALVEKGDLPEEEKTRLLARAKAHGYGLKVREESGPSTAADAERLTLTDALAGAESATELTKRSAPEGAADGPKGRRNENEKEKEKPRENKDTSPATPGAKKKTKSGPGAGAAISAFGYALIFAAAGVGAAYAATLGASELVQHGHLLPGLGKNVRPVFPIVLGLVGVLPAWLVYRLGAVIKALVVAAALGGVGWIAWGTGRGALHATREVQAIAFGLAGFLAALLVLGLLGGTKTRVAKAARQLQ